MPKGKNLVITLIYGENNYQARRALDQIVNKFEVKEGIERYEADSLSAGNLPNILSGLNLFTPSRLVIVTGASENNEIWAAIGNRLSFIPDEVHLVLFEDKVDKRTKTFKDLLKVAAVVETKEPSEPEALNWLVSEAAARNITLTPAHAQSIVSRVGLNQWQLHFALEKLAGFEELNEDLIHQIVETSPQASAFGLIDAALSRQPEKVQSAVKVLRVSEDAYFFFGLLASQIFQLVALASTKKPFAEIAKDLGVHPYPLQKMQAQARRLKPQDLKTITAAIADCDNQLKRSGAEPWLILEQALLKLAI